MFLTFFQVTGISTDKSTFPVLELGTELSIRRTEPFFACYYQRRPPNDSID